MATTKDVIKLKKERQRVTFVPNESRRVRNEIQFVECYVQWHNKKALRCSVCGERHGEMTWLKGAGFMACRRRRANCSSAAAALSANEAHTFIVSILSSEDNEDEFLQRN